MCATVAQDAAPPRFGMDQHYADRRPRSRLQTQMTDVHALLLESPLEIEASLVITYDTQIASLGSQSGQGD